MRKEETMKESGNESKREERKLLKGNESRKKGW